MIDATKVLNLNNYPPAPGSICRPSRCIPERRLAVRHRRESYHAFLTNAPRYNVAFLDARHRARGRCENRIKTLKSTGLGKLPYWSFAANQAWINVAVLAMNLTSWIQLTLLPVNHPAGCWDVKRWRYRLYSIAGKLITSSRKTRLLIPGTAPEATLLTDLLERAQAGYQQWRH
ncbi:transposase, partial [Arthrobacter sp. JCM 19049]|uniref:transposase n=1 Tax=Arthrobacter sp. JCM 19049 TaxID=1460643 RepID=UPI0024366315